MVSTNPIKAGVVDGSTVTLDTRLVAAVQAAAGARCHEAANLLQAYYMSTEACRVISRRGQSPAADEARALCHTAKVRLRDFLAERLLGWVTESPARRLDREDRQSAMMHFLDGATPDELDDLRAALARVRARRR